VTTRSDRLFAVVIPNGFNQVVYTAGPGFNVILKSVYGFQHVTSAAQFVLKIASPGWPGVAWFYESTATAQIAIQWQGWIVLRPGDQVTADNPAGSAQVWGSGALLPLGST
jgi:hypothetical protein